jgi:VCBS repeat-containing protein
MNTIIPTGPTAGRRTFRLAAAVLFTIVLAGRNSGQHPALAQGTGCAALTTPIACENALPGTPGWDISGAGDADVQGFATEISTNRVDSAGQPNTVHFKVKTTGAGNVADRASFTIDIYRLGYYRGDGARKVTAVPIAVAPAAPQPECLGDAVSGLLDCGNWNESAAWVIPTDAVSGVFLAKLTRADNSHASHIAFIVRDDARRADLVVQTSDTTWQAYNRYGGASLYCAPTGRGVSNAGTEYDSTACPNRATKASYNRPLDTRDHDAQSFVFNAEYPMIRFLEANGYDVKYWSAADTERRSTELSGPVRPRIFLSSGHDEYWSGGQRASVEAARSAGVNLAFFSGNEAYWKTRWENNLDPVALTTAAGTAPYRTLVTYKETLANTVNGDPLDPLDVGPSPTTTATWRDTRFGGDGGRPENALTGTIWTVNAGTTAMTIPSSMANLRFWRHTRIADLIAGQLPLTAGTVGYEWDEDLDNGFRPEGVIHLSSTFMPDVEKIVDFGTKVGRGPATHTMTIYRHTSGALVFGAGTVQWAWGLDGEHDRGPTTPDQAMQQATINLLADMGAQPSTLQDGADAARRLVAATATNDVTPPTAAIGSPATGARVQNGNRFTIAGTAVDIQGAVGGVEVSLDGSTWHLAEGGAPAGSATYAWTYDWSPRTQGPVTIRARAIDDSGNVQRDAIAANAVTVDTSACPCPSLWDESPAPPIAADNAAVEVGVKFYSEVDGNIIGLRFYKGPGNIGPHEGHLWSSGGALLASASFTSETVQGWQTVSFSHPIAITANAIYVASYHTTVGQYAATSGYFATAGIDSPPLHAPVSGGIAGANGVFAYGPGTFPTDTFNSTNYWVAPLFALDTTGPVISDVHAAIVDNARVAINWQTDEAASSVIEYSTSAAFPAASTQRVSDAALVLSHRLTLVGLQSNTTYYYRVTGADGRGNAAEPVVPPTFTLPGPTLRDTASVDFAAGIGSGTHVSEVSDGELILTPARAAEFSGGALPPGWTAFPWVAGGAAVVADGMLSVDGASAGDTNVSSAGQSLEFAAAFSADTFEHVGFSQSLDFSGNFAMFSTFDAATGIFARTSGVAATLLPDIDRGSPHVFRIDWMIDRVEFRVDGQLRATHNVAITTPMLTMAASDVHAGNGGVLIDWMRLTPYAAAGTFVSRTFDAGAPVDWRAIQWTADQPAGTAVAISVRASDSIPAAADTCAGFVPVSTPGPLSFHSRYVQYCALLTTSNSQLTPSLDDIVVTTDNAPVAVADFATVPQNGNYVFAASGTTSLLANDTDAEGHDGLRLLSTTPPAHGTIARPADGSVVYAPLRDFTGADTFAYTITDGLLTATATVTITVAAVNQPPLAADDFFSVAEDTVLTAPARGVLANDIDPEGAPLNARLQSAPSHAATFALSADGSFTYAPLPNYAGPDTFTYTASDGINSSAVATVSIAVSPVNDAPIAEDDAYTGVKNQLLVVNGRGVLANDHDVEVEDIAPLSVTSDSPVNPPQHGTVVLASSGSFTYTPQPDYIGPDSFTYRAQDHQGAASRVATVMLTIAASATTQAAPAGAVVSTGTDAVAADPVQSSVQAPAPATISIAKGVISGSTAPAGYSFLNQQVTIAVVSADGSDLVAAPSAPIVLTFTLDASIVPVGQSAATIAVFRNDLRIAECTAAVAIPSGIDACVAARTTLGAGDIQFTVLTTHASRWNFGVATGSAQPVAANDSYRTGRDLALTVDAPGVLVNDIASNSMSAVLVAPPANGTLLLAPTGAFTFTPAAGACADVRFTYTANAANGVSAVATASVVVDCPAVAVDDAFTTAEDVALTGNVLTNDTVDVDKRLQAVLVTSAAHGTLSLGADGRFSYTPDLNYNGTDSFTYRATDGESTTGAARVTITIDSVNDAPVAAADSYSVNEDTPLTVAAPGVLGNDTDVDGNALTAVLVSGPAASAGSVVLNANGSFVFNPAPNFNGTTTFSYTARDGAASSAVALVSIVVTPVNDAPVAAGDSYSLSEDTALSVAAPGLLANDTDADLNKLTAVQLTNPTHGTVTVNANGSFTYVPAANYNGSDSFTYAASDGTAQSSATTVLLTIVAVNDAPVALADVYSVAAGARLDVGAPGVLANDLDPDGDALIAQVATQPLHGSLVLNANGSFSYTPAAGYSGPDGFTYAASDGRINSSAATVSITVTSPATIVTWANPAAVPLNTALSYIQLNATANTPGTFVYNPPLNTVLNTAGSSTLSVTFTPTDSAHFAAATKSVPINVVAPGTQTMTATLSGSSSSVQYSDTISFTTTVTSSVAGRAPAGNVGFKVGTQGVGVAQLKPVGDPLTTTTYQAIWTGQMLEPAAGTLPTGQMRPGAKIVSAMMLDPDPKFVMTNPLSKSISINFEDARVAWGGASTTLSLGAGTKVPLTAAVTELPDGLAGDIQLATVQFINRSTGAVLGSATVGSDGKATFLWTATAGTYAIGFSVGNYYTRNNVADNVSITVTK